MEDLKGLETSLNSSMSTEMQELREMIAQLMPANKTSTPPSLEDPTSTLGEKASAKPGEEKLGDEHNPNSSTSKR